MSTSPDRAHAKPALLVTAFAIMCLVWGSTWIVIKEGGRDLPPFTGAAARFVIAFLVMALAARPLARLEGGGRAPWSLVAVTGVLQFFVSYAIVYWSETVLPAGLTAVLWSVYPLFVGLLSLWMLPGERLVSRQWLGFGLAFVGIAFLFWTDLMQAGAGHVRAGLVLLLSPFVVALANVYLRPRAAGVSAVLLNRDGLLVGATLLTLLAFTCERPLQVQWSRAALFSVGYLAAFGTCLTFSLYFWMLRYLSVGTLALMSYITPLVALTLGSIVGESYSGHTALGTAIVLLGVALARRGTKAR
ncbi:MAG: EamA family transporter [Planctomycetota bacterium]